MFERGKIVLVPFPFTDLSSSKIRPALIVSDPKYSDEDISVVFITSKLSQRAQSTDYHIKTTHTDFGQTGLKTASIVRCNKIATLDKKTVLGEIGFLSRNIQKKIDQKIKLYFGIK
ncbi:MAG: hypothetical protein A3G32_03920 [Deltaproteobacteria bacterium RIFCSPLOWO2_12_FULL_40_28]|nr:MAG: hypothetical protein A3C45_06005 [Deltaproteobacteria bacterium RIFCSPHIGHO2_02_FULL_40_28]OGQ20469.1 MAG: hypothetical protein A3E27_01800 [Deltaproteobacteria bacterium RIFCSPHIGHO2_12_FULL_40_32]OGQ41099.1 MAG: hypothetical protein A3I69_08665 [Deltaproteobacteria bacterium RIFCSPLOWO2_02_FULL_40_36]OGQ55079.1 MAG: hypothetical protein A3G32_03920 [Deltaproteobacteria bacterium RIFCSPLOWO2_12_FULL_40_28]